MAQKQGRKAPDKAPRTLGEIIEALGAELNELGQEIHRDQESLRQKELKHANLAGQLQAYASLKFDNPAEVDHGSEA